MSTMATRRVQGLQQRVLARVVELPLENPRQIADYLEADYNSVTRALSRLVRYRLIGRNEDATYFPIHRVDHELDRITESLESFVRFTPDPPKKRFDWAALGWAFVIAGLVALAYFTGLYAWQAYIPI